MQHQLKKFFSTKLCSMVIILLILTSLYPSSQTFLFSKLNNLQWQVQAQEPIREDAESAQRSPKNPALGLTISPPVSYLYLKPQQSTTHTLILTNSGQQTLAVRMQLTDFKPDGKTGRPLLSSGQIFNQAINPSLNFGQKFKLEPQENRSISLKIDAARLKTQKEYHLSLLFHAQTAQPNHPNQSPGNSAADQQPIDHQPPQASVAGTIASNLIIFISDQGQNQGSLYIKKITAPRFIDSFTHLNFSILAQNQGLNAMPITGQAEIYNMLGQVINRFVFYPDQVLADSTRLVRALEFSPDFFTEEGELDPSQITSVKQKNSALNINASNAKLLNANLEHRALFLLGPYQIQVNLGQQQRTITVIALPFSLLGAILLGVVIYFSHQRFIAADYNQPQPEAETET